MKKFYKNFSLLIIFTAFFSLAGWSQNTWINEIHYDNTSTDVDEFIEVIIENPGNYTLSDFSVVLYNGNGGASYNTVTLDQYTVGSSSGNFTIYWYNYTANGLSIQNGGSGGSQADGMALVYQGTVISGQFLSYEGTFTATDGPANGMLSVDIGVMEDNPVPPPGESLQLSGTGTTYASFTWQPPATATPGGLNNDQSLGGAPLPEPTNYPTDFASSADNITITVTWTDATGDQLPSKYLILVSNADNITPPVDGTPVSDDLDLSDGTGAVNVNYGLETYTFYHLAGETQYFFKIYPYTNAGTSIDYKTDGTAPSTDATTEPVINQEDFESNTFGTWTTYSAASDKDWAVVNYGGALNTTYFAQMNGYQESEPSNDWLISPSMNLDMYSNEKMLFYTQWRYGSTDTELKLFYSTDYTTGDPTAATWTELSFTKGSVQDIWTYSGNVSLAGITGSNVHVAFQYYSSGDPRRWGVDEIVICGGATGPSITVTSPVEGDMWEQGSSHDITWTASNTGENLMIEFTGDASSGNPDWMILISQVPADAGTWTWDIPAGFQTSDDCKIRISDNGGAEGLSGTFSIIEPIVIPQLVITEIMYNPPESGTDSLEFIELYNHDDFAVNMEGYAFTEGVDFTFPSLTLNPGDYVLVSVDSVAMQEVFGVMAYQFTGGLSNSGERITLVNNYGMVVDSVTYDDVDPWPTPPDGFGPSLTFCDPGMDNGIPDYWTASTEFAAVNADGDSIFATPGAGCASWPTAEFSADTTIVLTGGSVSFTDESEGSPDTWEWTFDGGDPASYSGQTPPPVTYNTPGDYDVTLVVTNAAGSSTEDKTNFIHVGDPPIADFSANPQTLYAGETVDFTDMSTGTIDTWAWEFEGGAPATSSIQNPTGILYSTEGIYNVTLTVTNMFGTDSMTKEDYIDVLPVGIGELSDAAIRIYPNPTSGTFNLINPYNEEMTVTVYSVFGQTVLEQTAKPGLNEMNLDDASNGIYFIHFTSKDGKVNKTERVTIY